MARPIKKINEKELEFLASIHCTMDEMSSFFGVHKRTLERRYAAIIEKGRNSGKMSLKRKMFEMAVKGDRTMLIWLSKNFLDMSDKVEKTGAPDVSNQTTIIYETEWGSSVEQPGPQTNKDPEAL